MKKVVKSYTSLSKKYSETAELKMRPAFISPKGVVVVVSIVVVVVMLLLLLLFST